MKRSLQFAPNLADAPPPGPVPSSSIQTNPMARTAVPDFPSTDLDMAHVDYRFRFFIIASIVSTILAIATANELAIESRPAPFALIRSTAPHSNYATPPTTTAPYPSITISPHVAGASSGADVQDLLLFYLCLPTSSARTMTPIRPAPPVLSTPTPNPLPTHLR